MNARDRLFSWAAGVPCGISWHTPSQSDFRSRARGRWVSDVVDGTHAPASSVRIYPDGTVDTVSLCHDGQSWLDLGGNAAVDFRAGRY